MIAKGDRVLIKIGTWAPTMGEVVEVTRYNVSVLLRGQWAERAGFERETVVQVSPAIVHPAPP